MSKDPKNSPNQISPELLKMLAEMQAKTQGAQGVGPLPPQGPPMTTRQAITMKAAQYIATKLQNGVKNVDRLINFVVHPTDPDRNDVIQTARKPILFGAYVFVIFMVFGVFWSSLAPLNSASNATGIVISDSKIQRLQFIENGNIKAIYVKEGDHVKAGDPLIALDETRTKSEYDTRLAQYRTYLAMEARLIAERDEQDKIIFPEFLLKDAAIPEVAKILHTQENLFESQRALIASNIEQLKKRLEGLRSAEKASTQGHAAQEERVKAARDLFSKGFLSRKDLQEIEMREGQVRTQLADHESRVAETTIQLNTIKTETTTKILRELREIQTTLADVREHFNRAEDLLEHSVLTSPVDGVVNRIHVTTIGGVIGAGNVVAEVSPSNETLVIEARVNPKDINSVRVGQVCNIRFEAFKSRTAPVFNGKVVSLSPDVVMENAQQGQMPSYIARVEIDMDEFNREAKKRSDLELHPGMQVGVNIITGTRTLLQYLLDPITDTMFRAFNEK